MLNTITAPRLVAAFVFAAALLVGSNRASADDSVCASGDQVQQIEEFYAENPGTIPALAARTLQIPDVKIASAMPANHIASAPAAGFFDIWESVTTWDQATTVILKDGHVFEIPGAIAPGKPSERSNYFNLDPGQPLGGHLRADQLSSIYVMSLPARGGAISRTIHFFDQSGLTALTIIFGGEGGGDPAEEELAKFEQTVALIESMPPVCGDM